MTDQNDTVPGANNPDQAEDLICQHCGERARRLPSGVTSATNRQLYEACWVPTRDTAAGPGDGHHHPLCGHQARLDVGLLAQVTWGCDDASDAFPDDIAVLPDPRLVGSDCLHYRTLIAFLRYAQQHPMVSTDLLVLLLARLEGIAVRPDGFPAAGSEGQSVGTLVIGLGGIGGRSTLLLRHKDELNLLIADLLGEASRVSTAVWTGRRWAVGRKCRVERVWLAEKSTSVANRLTWPGLEVDRRI